MLRRKRVVESDDEEESGSKKNPRISRNVGRRKTLQSQRAQQNSQAGNGKHKTSSIQAGFARAASRPVPLNSSCPPVAVRQLNLTQTSACHIPVTSDDGTESSFCQSANINRNTKIHSLLTEASQRQSCPSASGNKTLLTALVGQEDLTIDSSDDEPNRTSQVASSAVSHVGKQTTQHQFRLESKHCLATRNQRPPNSTGLQAFTDAKQAAHMAHISQAYHGPQRPWSEEYAPTSIDQLAVHKRKVQQVEDWLSNTVAARHPKRLLLLKGDAGTGKTVTIELLCRKLGISINEWSDPYLHRLPGLHRDAASSPFDDFIARANLFPSLTLVGSDATNPTSSTNSTNMPIQDKAHQLILIEQFPNSSSQSSDPLQSFRKTLLQFLSMPVRHASGRSGPPSIVPIVILMSESLLNTWTAASDSLTAHRLLGPDILDHEATSIVEFNPIPPTYMIKAINLVLNKRARQSGRRYAPSHTVLQQLSALGDIRSAISALEFFCLHHGEQTDWNHRTATTRSKTSANPNLATRHEQKSLQMITQREFTLGIFHAVGKVIYNKRELPALAQHSPAQPPAWLPQHHRPKLSQVDMESLSIQLGTSTHVFVAALHENYVLSCDGLTEDNTLDAMNGCLEYLSDSDLLSSDNFARSHSRYALQATTDALRQDEISYETSVRGMLFSLPHPVKRGQVPAEYVSGRGKIDKGMTAFRIMYPLALTLWRQKEQIEQLVQVLSCQAQRGELESAALLAADTVVHQHPPGRVASWRNSFHSSNSLISTSNHPTDTNEPASSLSQRLRKTDLVLEVFPFMQSIIKQRTPSPTKLTRQLDKVVRLAGLTMLLSSHPAEVAGHDLTEELETHGAGEKMTQTSYGTTTVTANQNSQDQHIQAQIDKLDLSDDEIEDYD